MGVVASASRPATRFFRLPTSVLHPMYAPGTFLVAFVEKRTGQIECVPLHTNWPIDVLVRGVRDGARETD